MFSFIFTNSPADSNYLLLIAIRKEQSRQIWRQESKPKAERLNYSECLFPTSVYSAFIQAPKYVIFV